MRKTAMIVMAAVLAATGLVSARIGNAQMPPPKTSAAFDKLKTLSGDWTGTAEGIPPFTSTIRLISNGTAIEETFNNDMDHQMVTVYSSDGNRVALTHFCSAGNQPRMETPADRENPNEYVFSFTGATNLASPDDLHMHRMVLNIVDADHFTEVWHAKMGGKDMPKEFSFERKK
jgi:hypothetical protein